MADELTIAMRLRGARAANAQLNETAGAIGRIDAAALRANRSTMKVASSLSRTGAVLTRYVTLPLAVGLGLAAKSSIDFSNKMRMVETQAGATAGEVKNLTPQVLDLAKISPQGPNDLADGLFRIESHGIRAGHAMSVLAAASDLATVGNSNLEDTTYALSAAVQTHIKGAEDDAKAAAMLNAIVGQGSMRMDELTGALSTGVLPSAKAFGLSLLDVGAALDVMTSRGMPAQQSATRLRMSFSLLGAPSAAADKVLRSIHLSGDMLAETMQRPKGLLKVIELLSSHMEGLDKAGRAQLISRAFGGGRSSAAIITLVQNAADLEKRMHGVSKQSGKFKHDVEAAKAEPLNRLRIAWSSIQVAAIKVGAVVVPLFVTMANGAAKVADALAGHPHAGLALLGALLILGPALKIGALAVRVFAAAQLMAGEASLFAAAAETSFGAAIIAASIPMLPWIALIALVAVGIYEVVKHFKFFKRITMDAIGWVVRHWKLLIALIPGVGPLLFLIVRNFKAIEHVAQRVWHWIEKVVKGIAGIASHAKGAGKALLHMIPGEGLAAKGVGAIGHVLGFGASGGTVMQTGPYVVGEKGPEVVHLNAGSNIIPNDRAFGRELVTVPVVVQMDGKVVAQTVARVVADHKARS